MFGSVSKYDERGREIISPIPTHFTVPVERVTSTLDYHRAKLLETREQMRLFLQQVREDSEYETFAEANDFVVEDDFEEFAPGSDFELDDDFDALSALAKEVHGQTLAENSGQNMTPSTETNMTPSTETQSPPESGS